ncbi:hypothetical protein [Dysgonomonas sp. 520]|uniref:hypothetical protein n=1 Tax=Dysgonomonas sp. 520 TaxID=2302931 RepID=UPI0013D3227E|nr:hypothetical protein [Dysgonomonas sp. 520]NDW10442.1 hypothetical protein [Dysgonomonas sp. 520]
MNYYKIDYRRFVRLLLPPLLRRPLVLAFLDAAIAPIASLYRSFMELREDSAYKLRINGQVCHLIAMLNDNFDFIERRIYITDAEIDEWNQFIWKEKTDRPVMLGNYMLQSERFIGADGIDFVVHIPASLNLNDDERARMKSLLRYYKLASKRYALRFSYE